jgi:glycosyltransferase involved in cell wall biosynthesis
MAPDAARLAIEWFGLDPAKVEVASLGVDTDMFVPPETSERKQQRKEIRASLGFRGEDIVCIYTGRFTSSKGPEILADAVDQLVQQGEPYRAVFVGGGPRSEGEALAQRQGCVVHQFVPTRELPPYYWAADIGVWPRQESTSMLDAAACGLPIAISSRVTARERVDGNGVTYEEGDAANLAAALLRLKQARIRAQLGAVGAEKMRAMFSWRRIAEERAEVYAAALARGR